MAVIKAKRSVHPVQLTEAARRNNRRASPARRDHPDRRKPAGRRTHNHSSTTWLRKVIHFRQAKGKLVEDVEFSTELGYHCISVNFKDKTSLNFAIDTSFTVETDYSNWKTGNQRILQRWRPIQNLEFRDLMGKR